MSTDLNLQLYQAARDGDIIACDRLLTKGGEWSYSNLRVELISEVFILDYCHNL